MANITYLFGAGASFNAVPIVKDLPAAIIKVINDLKSGSLEYFNIEYQHVYIKGGVADIRKPRDIAIENLEFLYSGCVYHASIDTFFKMLYLTGDYRYQAAKLTASLFFELYFHINPIVDNRYDAFLASIIQKRFDRLPSNINIISWNYDNQIERAYQKYLNNANATYMASDYLNLYSRNEHVRGYNTSGFCIFKLNGSAGTLIPVSQNNMSHEEILLKYFLAVRDQVAPGIRFDWDEDDIVDKFDENLERTVGKTHVLVVVGYSFPFFNRATDNRILSQMSSLNNVYIQDPNPRGIVSRISAIRNDLVPSQIETIEDVSQFYLPHEL